MPDEKKLDPFKPVQPSIPGVTTTHAKSAPAAAPLPLASAPRKQQSSSQALLWIALATVIVLIGGAGVFFWLHSMSPKASAPEAEPAADTSAAVTEAPKHEKLATGPGPVATVDDVPKPWSVKRFLFRDPVTSEPVPAMVVRLPDGNYWGFSLREPFGTCELEYIPDLDKLRSDYGYRAEHPMIGNPCNHSVYDLLKYGSSSSGGLVRGEVVLGTGIRPPMAIEIRVDGKQLIAGRME